MEDKKIIIEMECVHEHRNGHVMTCSWLNGAIRLVVDFSNGRLVVLNGNRVVEQRFLSGMSIEEFIRLEEQCQEASNELVVFRDCERCE